MAALADHQSRILSYQALADATNSNTYFMFSTARSGRQNAPVILWLNGGPGASSLLGFYDELGPFVSPLLQAGHALTGHNDRDLFFSRKFPHLFKYP